MGYNVTMEISIRIVAEKKQAALDAIKVYNDSQGQLTASTLGEALGEWGFECGVEDTGDIEYIYWEGGKWRDQEEILKAIAPSVTEGSTASCISEDGYLWGYAFKDGKIYGTTTTTVTDEEPLK